MTRLSKLMAEGSSASMAATTIASRARGALRQEVRHDTRGGSKHGIKWTQSEDDGLGAPVQIEDPDDQRVETERRRRVEEERLPVQQQAMPMRQAQRHVGIGDFVDEQVVRSGQETTRSANGDECDGADRHGRDVTRRRTPPTVLALADAAIATHRRGPALKTVTAGKTLASETAAIYPVRASSRDSVLGGMHARPKPLVTPGRLGARRRSRSEGR